MSELIRQLIKTNREEQHLTRELLGETILSPDQLRLLENGDGKETHQNYWLLRILLGRLHLHNSSVIFYLPSKDNKLANLEMEIQRNLALWRYQKAEEQLEQFLSLIDKNNELSFLVYYQLYTELRIRQNKKTSKDTAALHQFMENKMPNFEKRLLKDRLFSSEELSLIIAYYEYTLENINTRMKKLFLVIHYFKTNYAGQEKAFPFYSSLMLAYARCQYKSEEYAGCMEHCLEGLRVTNYYRCCHVTAELYELLADSSGKLLEPKLEHKSELTNEIQSILQNYSAAYSLYSTFYSEYQENHKKELQKKIEKWTEIYK